MSEKRDAPPSYATATGSSTTTNASSRLAVPVDDKRPASRNGIPAARRRSMEDEMRPLPNGWIRQFDHDSQHQFFVDTKANPPRSIWHHPHDDEKYLATLSAEEREHLQAQEAEVKTPIHHEHSTDEEGAGPSSSKELPPRPMAGPGGLKGFGRKLKDKATGTTHEERKKERAERAEEERRYYEAHQRFREAMQRAQATGQPQYLGKDRDGKEVYVEPARDPYGTGYYGSRGYGYNPYAQGPYTNQNARFIQPPSAPYGRPYGYGYGGGYGLPLAGGLLGGVLLGSLLF